jgi:AraC-like DNA-binding protein
VTLPPAEGKDHWSVPDCFAPLGRPPPVCPFIHRHYAIGMHTHDFIEVNLVLSGRGRHHVQAQALDTAAGDVFVIPPQVSHGYQQEENLDVFHLLVHPLFVQRHQAELRGLPGFLMLFTVEPYFRQQAGFRYGLHLDGDAFTQARQIQDLLLVEGAGHGPGRDLALDALALYWLVFLCQAYSAQLPVGAVTGIGQAAPQQWQAVHNVFALVEQRFREHLTLDDLARAAHMQRNYFCRFFRAATGLTPMVFLMQHRLQAARDLLRDTTLNVTEIGVRTGFYDTAHLSRAFTAWQGQSPTRFRNSNAQHSTSNVQR